MMGYIVCFARNLHIDVLQAAAGWWDRSAGQRGSARLGAKVARETCFSWQKSLSHSQIAGTIYCDTRRPAGWVIRAPTLYSAAPPG
jgi:hypothetical protein